MAEIPTANIPVRITNPARSRDAIGTYLDLIKIVTLMLTIVLLVLLIFAALDVRSALDSIGQFGESFGTVEGGLGCGENFDEPC